MGVLLTFNKEYIRVKKRLNGSKSHIQFSKALRRDVSKQKYGVGISNKLICESTEIKQSDAFYIGV